jgi:chorismate-pyruvate lyase
MVRSNRARRILFQHDGLAEGPRNPTGAVANQVQRKPGEILAAQLARTRLGVTAFLEHLVNERIYADVILRARAPAGSTIRFPGLPPDVLLEHREAVLRGRRTDSAYVYAKTLYLATALPLPARRDLQERQDPIGTIIVRHGLSVERVDVTEEREPLDFRCHDESSIYARRYGIRIAGKPVMEISEWFLSKLAGFLPAGLEA